MYNIIGGDVMSVSKAKQASNKKYDKANFKYQSVKLKISEYERLKQAVELSKTPTNSFLRAAIMQKVDETITGEMDGGMDE